ncbi:MAG: HEPN domain-containing protein [Methanomassiliicoccaceae archaeon]|nr:HEPN domain-containing protein [Methanomassiliicoccaceae archaeon]
MDSDDELLAQIGSHLQQFTEKKMKACLQEHGADYPKTHDLVSLLKLFPQEKITEEDEMFAYVLSRFAVESRYFDSFEPPLDGWQMMTRTKKFAESIETLWKWR